MIALGLSLTVLGIEIGGGLLAGSLALLSDAAHVLVDVVALCVGLGAAHMAAREPDEHHTYGFHRLEAMGTLVNAILLIAASAVVLVDGVGRLLAPSPVDARVVLAAAIIGLMVNGPWAFVGIDTVNRSAPGDTDRSAVGRPRDMPIGPTGGSSRDLYMS
jgi:cobalt-zinc-cadmium efflux system protein